MSNVSTNWKTISQKKILDNKYFEVWEDIVELPDGTQATYAVWRKKPFSLIIPLDNDGNLYMVRQYRYAINSLSLEFPMGASDESNPEETARRELKEETGLTASSFKQIAWYWSSVGRSDGKAFIYLAEGLTMGEQQLDEGEFIDIEKYTVEKVGEMIDKGEIHDGQTIAAFHFLEKYLHQR